MTPFMLRILRQVGDEPDSYGEPELRGSVPRTIGQGAHEQVELRSLAEQLICEANAVLGSAGFEPIVLEDQFGTHEQAFSLRYGERWARIVTRFGGGNSLSQLLGPDFAGPMRELADDEALADLITVLVGAGRAEATS